MTLYRATKHYHPSEEAPYKFKQGELVSTDLSADDPTWNPDESKTPRFRQATEKDITIINSQVPGLLEKFDQSNHMPPVYDAMARKMYDPMKREHFGEDDIDDPKETAKKEKAAKKKDDK